MAQKIEIDREVWNRLSEEAEPFVDTPNTVLRRILGLDPAQESPRAPAKKLKSPSRGERASVGSLLPESEYELPILEVLHREGGQAPTREVVAAVGEIVGPKLKPADLEELPNGGIRWENRVQFARLRLKERGMVVPGSPRGIWELSELGAAEVEKARHES